MLFCRRCFDCHGTIIFCPFLANAEILAASSGVRKVKIFCISSLTTTTFKKYSLFALASERQFQNLKILIKKTHTLGPTASTNLTPKLTFWKYTLTTTSCFFLHWQCDSCKLKYFSAWCVTKVQLSHPANVSYSWCWKTEEIVSYKRRPPLLRDHILTHIRCPKSAVREVLGSIGRPAIYERAEQNPRMIKCSDEDTWLPI